MHEATPLYQGQRSHVLGREVVFKVRMPSQVRCHCAWSDAVVFVLSAYKHNTERAKHLPEPIFITFLPTLTTPIVILLA
jgi:hypothetical protein